MFMVFESEGNWTPRGACTIATADRGAVRDKLACMIPANELLDLHHRVHGHLQTKGPECGRGKYPIRNSLLSSPC